MVDFTDMTPNEILETLEATLQVFMDQYDLAFDALPSSMIIDAFKSSDVHKTFFVNLGIQHLAVVRDSIRSMKIQPLPVYTPIEPGINDILIVESESPTPPMTILPPPDMVAGQNDIAEG